MLDSAPSIPLVLAQEYSKAILHLIMLRRHQRHTDRICMYACILFYLAHFSDLLFF